MILEVTFWSLIFLSIAVQLWFHWVYFKKLPDYIFPKQQSQEESPISVVVAAHNEERNLPNLVLQILRQDYQAFELIVVNDRSTDNSATILNELAFQHQNLKVAHIHELPEGWNGKKHALQLGIETAQHEIVLLTDADCLPNSNQWIRKMGESFTAETDFVLGFSPYKKERGLLNQFIQFETLLTGLQYLSFAIKKQPYMGVGRNMAYRKSVFVKHSFQGFESTTGGDDDLFVNAHANETNTVVCIHPQAFMTSLPKRSWSEYFTQKVRHLSVGKKYRKKDKTLLGAFALSTLIGWILLFYGLSTAFNTYIILVIFSIRSLSFYAIFTLSGRKLKVKMAFWALPLFDLCFTVYYPLIGLVALTAKKVKWS